MCYVNNATINCLLQLETVVSFVAKCTSSDTQMAVLTSLISPPSNVLFDNVTRTKTVASIVAKACKVL
jgi:hypothetical protein